MCLSLCLWVLHGLTQYLSHPQAKIQKHQEFEAEIAAHNSFMTSLKSSGLAMVSQRHFATEQIKVGEEDGLILF